MLGIGQRFPAFALEAVTSSELGSSFHTVTHETHGEQWQVIFFWPKDYTFVCPADVREFGKLYTEFAARGAQILGVSVHSKFTHLAWLQAREDLRDLPFPLLSDIKCKLSRSLGLDETDEEWQGIAYIVDPEGTIRAVVSAASSVGRNPEETLKALDALQAARLPSQHAQHEARVPEAA